jgi:hypothetical protein
LILSYSGRGSHFRKAVLSLILAFIPSFPQSLTCISQTTTESQVAPYSLPNPLLLKNGTLVTTTAQWNSERRPEILELFADQVYGRCPPKPADLRFEIVDNTALALNGKAIRKQITIYFNGLNTAPKMNLLIYLPKAITHPVPLFLAANFWGNHTVNSDPGILLGTSWVEASNSYAPGLASCVQNHKATATCRGINSSQWPLDSLFNHGYGFATFYRGDMDADTMTLADTVAYTHFKKGLYGLYPELQGRKDNFTALGAWAWAMSRAMDYLEMDSDVDAKRVAVLGWSRLGKAALWAGAQDPRFAMIISDESGAGGAALSRRLFGEDVCRLVTHFPHWFAGNFQSYSNHESALPIDQHELIAALAPRPVYVSSAEQDLNADPKGEFLALKAAESVYKLFGFDTLSASTWPALEQPVYGGRLGYHVRRGAHDLTAYDWSQYLHFADMHLSPVTPTFQATRGSRHANKTLSDFSLSGKKVYRSTTFPR